MDIIILWQQLMNQRRLQEKEDTPAVLPDIKEFCNKYDLPMNDVSRITFLVPIDTWDPGFNCILYGRELSSTKFLSGKFGIEFRNGAEYEVTLKPQLKYLREETYSEVYNCTDVIVNVTKFSKSLLPHQLKSIASMIKNEMFSPRSRDNKIVKKTIDECVDIKHSI